MPRLFVSLKLLRRRNLATAFRTHIINSPKETEHVSTSSPVRVLGSCSFMYMRHNDVYILAVTKSNANVMLSFQFMTQVQCYNCNLDCGQHCIVVPNNVPCKHEPAL